jgi:hypothetical protein
MLVTEQGLPLAEAGRKLDVARMERDILKGDGVLRQSVEVHYAVINQLRKQHPVPHLCTLPDVAKSVIRRGVLARR